MYTYESCREPLLRKHSYESYTNLTSMNDMVPIAAKAVIEYIKQGIMQLNQSSL